MRLCEQETIVRWDREDPMVTLWTSNPHQAERWRKLGYTLVVDGLSPSGEPQGWRAYAEVGCVTFRRVDAGRIIRRKVSGGFQKRQGLTEGLQAETGRGEGAG